MKRILLLFIFLYSIFTFYVSPFTFTNYLNNFKEKTFARGIYSKSLAPSNLVISMSFYLTGYVFVIIIASKLICTILSVHVIAELEEICYTFFQE